MKNISISDVLSGFQTGEINKEELEEIIKDLVKKDSPDKTIDSIDYTDGGIVITLDSEETIEIEIDWNEIILEEETDE